MELAAVFLPLLAFLVAAPFGRLIGDRASMAITTGAVVLAMLASWVLFFTVTGGETRIVTLFTWIDSGDFDVAWALRVDTLTVVMLIVVNTVSAMVHIYSIGYMSHDPNRSKFFAYFSLFTFMMLMLVTADNLVQLYFGWEGVGLTSYLLIGFWHERASANNASIKAFVMNRVGDFGFALGIMGVFLLFGTVEFEGIFAAAAEHADTTFMFLGAEVHALTTICLLLFVGAMGKSAQLGLHTWLPDAMEGPTPVSALIHAATMVTAGVFMLVRLSPIYEYAPAALAVVAVLGALTAFVAATIALTQHDIKRVIAYSTMSQLGYMFFAIGVSAYSAAIFHLMTHAFFKALLFLGAGSVIHAMSDEQDMRKMGGLYRLIPQTYALMWIGSLALAGIGIPYLIGFAGFYSKDIVLEAAIADHTWFGDLAYWLGIAAAVMTAFYSWRLLFLTFHGTSRADEHTVAHVHESPPVMLVPLYVLAFGAVFAGALGYGDFVSYGREAFWGESVFVLPGNDTIEAAHHLHPFFIILPAVAAVLGILLAYWFYIRKPGLPQKVASGAGPLDRLFARKWYFDEIYNALVVLPARGLGWGLWRGGDNGIIDGLGPNGMAASAKGLSRLARRLQTGYLYHYAFVMLVGVLLLLSWYIWTERL